MPEISYVKLEELQNSSEEVLDQKTLEHSKKTNFFKRAWEWSTKDKGRIGSLIFILLFIVIIIILAVLGTNLGDVLSDIIDWFEIKVGKAGLFIGVFVISIFGNFTVIFPVPYTFALVAVATRSYFSYLDIIIMGLCAGAGAAIGETSAWFFGKASKKVIEEGMEKQVSKAQKWIDKGLTPFIIFIFAATPLPDDAVLIFIGLLGYSLWKTIIWCFLGKIVLTSATGLVTKLFVNTSFGEKILWLFGLSSENGQINVPDPKIWQSAIVWFISIVLIGVVLFVDWAEIWNSISSMIYKRRIIKLLELPNNQRLLEKAKKKAESKSTHLVKENHYWLCSIYDKQKNFETEIDLEKNLTYIDLLAVSYVVDKPIEVHSDNQWYNNLKSNAVSKFSTSIVQNNIWELESPTEENDSEIEDTIENDIAVNSEILSIWLKHPKFRKEFNFNYLIEKEGERIRIDCIGEKEASAIKLIKKYPRELILSKIIGFLEELENLGENITKISIAQQNKAEKDILANSFKI
ncbi:MAG: hypothetical protein FK730_13525 [Asgard group archaeon]|nr:hypothetical protein [Asgard group archaeon]